MKDLVVSLYKYRSRPIINERQHNQSKFYFLLFFTLFVLVFFSFHRLDLVSTALTSKVIVDHISSTSRHRLAEEEAHRRSSAASLTIVGPDKTGLSGLSNFEQELPALIRFM
jgi:hypothetical protein